MFSMLSFRCGENGTGFKPTRWCEEEEEDNATFEASLHRPNNIASEVQ